MMHVVMPAHAGFAVSSSSKMEQSRKQPKISFCSPPVTDSPLWIDTTRLRLIYLSRPLFVETL